MNLTDSTSAAKLEQMVAIMSIAVRVLSARLVTILSLALNTGVVIYAMVGDSWVRLAAAAVFGAASWCIVNLKPKEPE